MSTRPYFHLSGRQLLELFEGNKDGPQVLKGLRAELQHRSTRKMRELLVKVEARLVALGEAKPERPTTETASFRSQDELFGPEALSGAQVLGGEADGRDVDGGGDSSSDNSADDLPRTIGDGPPRTPSSST